MIIKAFFDRKDIFGNRFFQEDVNYCNSYDFDFKKTLAMCFRQVRKHEYTDYSFRFEFCFNNRNHALALESKPWEGDESNDVYSVSYFEEGKGYEDTKKMSKKAVIDWLNAMYQRELEQNAA